MKVLTIKNVLIATMLMVSSAVAAPVDDLAKTLYHEARGEGEKGIRAVASIIHNRAAKDNGKVSPSKLSSVVRQKYQFSCWNGKKNLNSGKGDVWKLCQNVANEMVKGEFQTTHSYTHYYAFKHCNPKWAKGKKKVVIGNHAFLNP